MCDDFDSPNLLEGWNELLPGPDPKLGTADTAMSDRSAPRALFIRGVAAAGTNRFASGASIYRSFDITRAKRAHLAVDVRIDKVGLKDDTAPQQLAYLGFKRGSLSVVSGGVNLRRTSAAIQGATDATQKEIASPPRGKWFRLELDVSAVDGGSTIEVLYDGISVGSVKSNALDADSVGLGLGAYLTAPVDAWSTAYDNLTFDLE